MRIRWLLPLAAALTLAAVPAAAQQRPAQPAQPAAPAAPAAPKLSFSDLQAKVRAMRDQERELNQQREAAARAEAERQEARARDMQARRDRAEARSEELSAQWDANEVRYKELTDLLAQKQGNLGELFGVTRQVAGDAANVLQQSMLTAQYAPGADGNERVEFLRDLAGAKALPGIDELERMWYELVREMTDAAKVQAFPAGVQQLDKTVVDGTIVRVGPFTAVSNGDFLGYLPSEKSFSVLDGRLPPEYRSIASALQDSTGGEGTVRAVVDPARGALLGLYLERPDWIQRIQKGEAVGYVIIAVGLLGLLLAVFQFPYLFFTRMAVNRQLRDMSRPRKDNPLGRVLMSFREGAQPGEPRELAELRLSEAVLVELPKLERFQSLIRLFVAAGPLLGLIGTVIGMIITFKAITAAGTSDPRLMAQGIGQAMIATVLGLGVAIPLLFINSFLTGLSRSITHVLDEHSNLLLAEREAQGA